MTDTARFTAALSLIAGAVHRAQHADRADFALAPPPAGTGVTRVCYFGGAQCEPAVAIARLSTGRSVSVCHRHLDDWLDQADDHPTLEPRNLWWISREAA